VCPAPRTTHAQLSRAIAKRGLTAPRRSALGRVQVFDGPTRALVTVENLGAWRDMPCPPNTLLAHVPGWDTATARRLLSTLAPLPVLHFGDLNPPRGTHRHPPRLVHELANARLWLEQEVVVLDPRFAGELEEEVAEVVAAGGRG
jgi:hypothetical protein